MAISIICADADYTITTTTTEKNYLNGCAEWNGMELSGKHSKWKEDHWCEVNFDLN